MPFKTSPAADTQDAGQGGSRKDINSMCMEHEQMVGLAWSLGGAPTAPILVSSLQAGQTPKATTQQKNMRRSP